MKFVIAFIGAVLVAGVAFGATTIITNAMGQVYSVAVDEYGTVISVVTSTPNLPASQTRSQLDLVGVQLENTAFNTTNTLFTPRDIGDILIGKTLGTGDIWMATGATTNDWKGIYTP